MCTVHSFDSWIFVQRCTDADSAGGSGVVWWQQADFVSSFASILSPWEILQFCANAGFVFLAPDNLCTVEK